MDNNLILNSTIFRYEPIYKPKWYNRWTFRVLIIISLILLGVLIPSIAWAHPEWPDFLTKPFTCVMAALNGSLIESVNVNFESMFKTYSQQSVDTGGMLTAAWDDLFKSGTGLHDLFVNISNGAVKPIAGGVLSCVFLMQFIKMAGKSDANGAIPYFKEMIVMFVLLAIFTFLVAHADEICGLIYSLINTICKAIASSGALPDNPTQDFIWVGKGAGSWESGWGTAEGRDLVAAANTGVLILLLISTMLGGGIAWLVSIIAILMIYMRSFQLYLYAAFAPIPFSVLGFEETRNWGVGFFKSFAAVALAGAIMMFAIAVFPMLFAAILGGNDITQPIMMVEQLNTGAWFSEMGTAMAMIGKIFAGFILLAISLIKSGGWARDVLGG